MLLLLLTMAAHPAETLVAWDAQRVTLGNANVMTLFNIPEDCRYVQFKFESSAGHLTTAESGDCTDAGTKDATDYFLAAADTWHEIRVPGSEAGRGRKKGGTTLCLSAATNATVVNVMCTSDHD